MAMRGLSEVVGELYKLYPRHIGKRAADRAIGNAIKRLQLELKLAGKEPPDVIAWIIEAVECFANSPAGQRDGLFKGYAPPYPATWFNQSRYLDDPEEWFQVSMSRRDEEERRMASEATVGMWRPS